MVNIAQLSDTHLSHRRSYSVANVRAVIRAIAEAEPDFVVHTGDIVADDPDDEEERAFAVRFLAAALPQPFAVLPGNHDTGGFSDDLWSPARNDAFCRAWGADTFSVDLDVWRLVGANVYRLGEPDHDAWLAAQCTTDRPLALFLHQPVFLRAPAEADSGDWSLDLPRRGHLLQAIGDAGVRFVASGHLHRYLSPAPGHVVAPSAGFLGPPTDDGSVQEIGYVSYDLHDDGTFSHELVVPPGVEPLRFHAFAGAGAHSVRDAPLLPVRDVDRAAP